MELAEILGGAPAPAESASTVEAEAVQPAEAPTTTVGQQTERPRDERGRFLGTNEPEPVAQPATQEPAPAPVEDEHRVPRAALIAERRQRQELQQRLSALEAQQQQPPQLKDDDFWQSPAEATTRVVGQVQAQLQQEIARVKYEIAEDLTRSAHQDYDEVRDSFIAKVEARDPWALAIVQQMPAQANPAKFVYDQSKRLEALSAIGDPSAFRERIKAEVRAEMLKEFAGQQQRAPAPVVPKSLNSEPSASVPSSAEAFEPTPLGNLFDTKF